MSSTLMAVALTPIVTSDLTGAGGTGTLASRMASATVPTSHQSVTNAAFMVAWPASSAHATPPAGLVTTVSGNMHAGHVDTSVPPHVRVLAWERGRQRALHVGTHGRRGQQLRHGDVGARPTPRALPSTFHL